MSAPSTPLSAQGVSAQGGERPGVARRVGERRVGEALAREDARHRCAPLVETLAPFLGLD